MDKLSQIKSPVISDLEQFKELFNSSLDNSNPLLQEVLSHIKQRGGKMMRPILVLLIARLLGKVSQSTLHSAVSLELLHTASLVHDDVVDESSERRGQASVNALYNNKVSILVGDYLLATCLFKLLIQVIMRL
jgi:Geranylgeranyl pyrophosphate synthase